VFFTCSAEGAAGVKNTLGRIVKIKTIKNQEALKSKRNSGQVIARETLWI
jgi:hypothetical protein